jgi:ribosomal protein S18 acetylase RimI-like enzyme
VAIPVRRLGASDPAVLAALARDEADFDVAGRSAPRAALHDAAARAFLADDNVLFWVAEGAGGEDTGAVIGFLSCQLVRRRADAPELLLYEIGVRAAHRRSGIGRALVAAMDAPRCGCSPTTPARSRSTPRAASRSATAPRCT